MKTSLILACAGKGLRAGLNKNKLLFSVQGKTVLESTLSVFTTSGLIDQIIVTASKEDFETVKSLVGTSAQVVLGGDSRSASVKNALEMVDGDIVLIHDGARPFLTQKMISDSIKTASEFGSAIPILPSRNTILRTAGGKITEYVGKDELSFVQTPQAFKTQLIKKAYALAGDKVYNDDGQVYLDYVGTPTAYDGDEKNIKLTFNQDFSQLENKPLCRMGTGFDCHKLVQGRKLILGGITIEHDKGLLGHSDADVLTHAIMDAILSALSLRDIGYHFSDKDPQYKDADSIELLRKVLLMIKEKGYAVESISASIMAEKPKLLSYIPLITKNLAQVIGISPDLIGIGATTLEGLGFVGREEGICTHATAVLKRI